MMSHPYDLIVYRAGRYPRGSKVWIQIDGLALFVDGPSKWMIQTVSAENNRMLRHHYSTPVRTAAQENRFQRVSHRIVRSATTVTPRQ